MNMEIDLDVIPASKGDIKRILDHLEILKDTSIPLPVLTGSENPLLMALEKRLALIEKANVAMFKTTEMGLNDLPIDVETAAAITGLAISTIEKYGSYRHIKVIKIGKKRQFSLRDCFRLITKGTVEAIVDCTTDMTNYRRKKRKNR